MHALPFFLIVGIAAKLRVALNQPGGGFLPCRHAYDNAFIFAGAKTTIFDVLRKLGELWRQL